MAGRYLTAVCQPPDVNEICVEDDMNSNFRHLVLTARCRFPHGEQIRRFPSSAEETARHPLYADRGNFYKVEKSETNVVRQLLSFPAISGRRWR